MERLIVQDCARIALKWAETHESLARAMIKEGDIEQGEKHRFAAEQIRLIAATYFRDSGVEDWEKVLKPSDGLNLHGIG